MAHNSNVGGSKAGKLASGATSAGFGMNMPLMSSAFDTSMWLNAA